MVKIQRNFYNQRRLLKSSSLSAGVDAEAGGEPGEAGERLPGPEQRGHLQVIH